MIIEKTVWAIYDVNKKVFKGRGNVSGASWSEIPTQTYDTAGRATSAMKSHLKRWNSHLGNKDKEKFIIVVPVMLRWNRDI